MIKIILSFLALINLACSSISIESQSQKSNISLDANPDFQEKVEMIIHKDFYLYGLIPNKHTLDVAKYLKKQGHHSISDLKIEKVRDYKNNLWSLFSLGFYMPETYKLYGYVYKERE